jgi:hypothetical protein
LKAREAYVQRAERGRPTIADWVFSSSQEQAEASAATREETSRTQIAQLARMCVGDLAGDSRYDDAIHEAVRFGLLDEAERLAKIAAALKATPPPAP